MTKKVSVYLSNKSRQITAVRQKKNPVSILQTV